MVSVEDIFPWSVIYGHVNAKTQLLEAVLKSLARDCASELLSVGCCKHEFDSESSSARERWLKLGQYLKHDEVKTLAALEVYRVAESYGDLLKTESRDERAHEAIHSIEGYREFVVETVRRVDLLVKLMNV